MSLEQKRYFDAGYGVGSREVYQQAATVGFNSGVTLAIEETGVCFSDWLHNSGAGSSLTSKQVADLYRSLGRVRKQTIDRGLQMPEPHGSVQFIEADSL